MKKSEFSLLTHEEMAELDLFLMERVPDDADCDSDEGVLNLSELDGLLTAVVSGPVFLPMSTWMPSVWGAYEPAWESEPQVRHIMDLIMRHYDGIARMLSEQPDAFEPIFLSGDEGEIAIVDDWCAGYLRGMAINGRGWGGVDADIQSLLEPIVLFGSDAMDEELEQLPEQEIIALQQMIAPIARVIYQYWLDKQQDAIASLRSEHLSNEKVGRNDPCPCNSGKKFKRCCGSPVGAAD